MMPRFSRPRLIVKALVFLVLFALGMMAVAVGGEAGGVVSPSGSGWSVQAGQGPPQAVFHEGRPMPS